MKNQFHKRIFISISIFIAGITFTCVAFLSIYTYHSMKRQTIQNLSQLCESTSAEFDFLIDEMNKLSLFASTNRIVMEIFMNNNSVNAPYTASNHDIYSILNSLSTPNSSNRFRISLYSENGLFFSTGIPYNPHCVTEKLNSASTHEWYADLPIKPNAYSILAFHEDYWTDGDNTYLSLFREIFDPYQITDSNGIIEVQCPYDTVRDLFLFQDDQSQAYLLNSEGDIILSSSNDAEAIQDLADKIQEPVGPQGNLGNLIYCSTPLSDGYRLIITQPQTHIWNVIFPQIAVIILMGAVALLLILTVIFTITKHSTEPLRRLTSEIRQVSVDTPTLHLDNLDFPDEIYSLNQAFGQMFQRIHAFTNEIIAVKTSEMRANMIALQAQINPHFLYNMLAVIKVMSQEGSNAQIEASCDYLVKMLRYTSSYDKADVSLKEEITYINYYLSLMKMRYEDYFEYTIEAPADDRAKEFILPRLTLLPLLENAFKHGFQASAPPWSITVRYHMTSDFFRLVIIDNGCGIPPKKQNEIQENFESLLRNPGEKISSLTFGGTGLINTLARMKLKYKEKFNYTIAAPSEGGTTIQLEVKLS